MLTIILPDGAQFNKETTTMAICGSKSDVGTACLYRPGHASAHSFVVLGADDQGSHFYNAGTADHPHGPTAYADALKGMDPLTAKIHALKAAELSLTAHTQGAIARRVEIRALKAEVAKLYFETLGKKPRVRKAGK